MADARPRSTMQPAPDTHGKPDIRSGIPIPATIKKPAANGRAALRAPYQTPGTGRLSVMRSQNPNPLLQSTSKPPSYGRTPRNNSTVGGSVLAGGASLAPPSSSQILKDVRPLRDRKYQAKTRQDILSFLQGEGLDITMASLAAITGKDYRAIFDFLLLILDPSYPLSQSGRFEDEFVPALKALRYPFAHQIDNKWLAAPASMHSWPALLGALHWLVEMCKLRGEYLSSGHPTLQHPVNIPEVFDDQIDHRALAFDYFDQAYTEWLDMKNEFPEANQYLEDRYARKNERVQTDLEDLTNRLNQAKAESNKLKSSAAPVAKLQNENSLLITDSEKFEKILQQYEGRKKKLIDTIAYEKTELATDVAYLGELKQEQDRLAVIVKAQNLSPEEVVRMNTVYETLSRCTEDLAQKLAETHKVVMTLEVNVTHRAEAAEEALDAYTNLLNSLGLFRPLPPPFQDVDLTLELNSASSSPQLLLSGADIRKVVKPALSGVAESKRLERATSKTESIKVDDELERLTLECENVDDEIGELEKTVLAVNEQADQLRDATQQEAYVASEEAARLEGDLALARTAAMANGMGVKRRLQALQFDYREQIDKVSRLKEETVRAITKNSHDIAIFKEKVSRHLRELREFAEGG